MLYIVNIYQHTEFVLQVAEQLRVKKQMQSILVMEVCLKVLCCVKYPYPTNVMCTCICLSVPVFHVQAYVCIIVLLARHWYMYIMSCLIFPEFLNLNPP